jgi:hypothetical protein
MTRSSKASLAGEASPNCVTDFADNRRLAHRLTTSPNEEISIMRNYSTSTLPHTSVVALGWILAWCHTLALILRPLACRHQLLET